MCNETKRYKSTITRYKSTANPLRAVRICGKKSRSGADHPFFCGGRGSETVSPGRVAGPVCYDCRHKRPVAPLAPLAGRAGAVLSWEGKEVAQ